MLWDTLGHTAVFVVCFVLVGEDAGAEGRYKDTGTAWERDAS